MNRDELRKQGFVSVMDAAAFVGVSAERVRQWIRAGELTSIAPTPRKTFVKLQQVIDRLPAETAKVLGLQQTRRK